MPYPQGANGYASVVVELVVTIDGTVREARVVQGDEPFASAALSAASTWRYEPARRGDKPVAARIRVLVEFKPDVPVPQPEAPSPEPAGAPKPASSASPPVMGAAPKQIPEAANGTAPTHAPIEVVVRGRRKDNPQLTLRRADIQQLPGAFGDPFRAIESLPGVTPIVSGLPYFFVRGAPPGNTGYFLDDIRVPALFHLGIGPGVIHPGLVDRMDFFPGGYPARFGRFAGGIVAADTIAPREKPHAEGSLRLFDAGALIESPFGDGRGSALAAGRYSYTGALFSLFSPDAKLDYWDYQTRVGWSLSGTDRVSVFAFGSHDVLAGRDWKTGQMKEQLGIQFHRVDLRYEHQTATLWMRAAITLGRDRVASAEDSANTSLIGSRVAADWTLSDTVRVRAGLDNNFSNNRIDRPLPPEGQIDLTGAPPIFASSNDLAAGAWVDTVLRLTSRVEVVPGIRIDLFSSVLTPQVPTYAFLPRRATAIGVDPRLATNVRLTSYVLWRSTFGIAHQPPTAFVASPGLHQLARLDQGLQWAAQASQGLDFTLPFEITLGATGFVQRLFNLVDASVTCNLNDVIDDQSNLDTRCLSQRTRGQSYGIELMARRPLSKRVAGFVSYTLSRTTREAPEQSWYGGLDAQGNPSYPVVRPHQVLSEFDRTHVLGAALAVDLGRRWRAGSRLTAYSGRPYYPETLEVGVRGTNTGRLAAFYRLDLRLEKRWPLGDNGSIAFVAEWLNALLRKEEIDYQCSFSTATFRRECAADSIGPITVPNIGVEGAI